MMFSATSSVGNAIGSWYVAVIPNLLRGPREANARAAPAARGAS